jgi:lipoprotein-releasing system permease protein
VLGGLDTATAGRVIGIEGMVKRGNLSSLDVRDDGLPTIIPGTELARQLGIQPGDVLTVVSPQGRLTPLGRVPSSRRYKVSALFDSGMYEYDASLAFVSLREAQDLLEMENRVTGVEV